MGEDIGEESQHKKMTKRATEEVENLDKSSIGRGYSFFQISLSPLQLDLSVQPTDIYFRGSIINVQPSMELK